MLCGGYMLLAILTVKKLLERFAKVSSKRQIKKNLELKEEEKVINHMSNGKVTIIPVIDTSELAKKNDLASLKSHIDKLDTGKLEITHVDLSNVEEYYVVKKLYFIRWLES